MTNTEFLKAKDDIEKKYADIFEEDVKRWEVGEYPVKYAKQDFISSDEFDYGIHTPDDMRKLLSKFEAEVAKLPKHLEGRYSMQLEASNYYDSTEISEANFRYTFTVLGEPSMMEDTIKREVKRVIEDALMPSDAPYRRQVECKLLELFVQGSIDFKTLQTLTYSDCKL